MEKNQRIAIIGSGPVSMIEAIYQVKSGNRVVLFEKTNRLGGAWSTIKYDDDHEFELGCHIWEYDKSTYLFIEKLLCESLEVLRPRPVMLIKEKRIPYDWKNNWILFKNFKHDPLGFISGHSFVKPSFRPKKYRYPKDGCKRMIQKLEQLLEEHNVEIIRNKLIQQITVDGKVAILNNEKQYHFDKAFVTSLSDLNEVKWNKKVIPVKSNPTIFTHYHLILDGEKKQNLSYVRVMDHPFIHRVSDMSSQSIKGELVLSVGVFKDKLDKLAPCNPEQVILEALVKYGYFSKDTKLIKSYFNQFKGGTIDHFQINELQKLPNFEVLRSTNLIYSIRNHLKRWNQVF